MTTKNKKTDENRQPREAQTREKQEARKPWAPPSALDAPNPPEGYVHRWVRLEIRGQDDRKNVMARLREGWEPVRADEYPDFESPIVEEGKFEGVIGVGGLVLARIPTEIVDQRNQYFAEKTDSQMKAVDNNLFKEQHPSMPIHSNRNTKVTFGGGKE